MSKKIIGYINLWNIPSLDVPYSTLETLADQVGFDKRYVPKSPKARGAWETATNLGEYGLKVTAPTDRIAQIERLYGVKPVVKLTTEIISRSAPDLARQIVRKVYIPTKAADLSPDLKQAAETQLSSEAVALLEFDCTTNSYKFTGYDQMPDSLGLVNGGLQKVLEDIRDRIYKELGNASGNDIRNSIREWFTGKQNGKLMTAGGAYFVPNRPGTYDELKACKLFLELLNDYLVEPNGRKAQLMIVALTEEGDGYEDVKADIALNAMEQFKVKLQTIANEIAPILNGQRTQNISDKVRQRATMEFLELNNQIAEYREVLSDELQGLDIYLQATQEFIIRAQSVTEYKISSNKDEE